MRAKLVWIDLTHASPILRPHKPPLPEKSNAAS
jgi:hypothetical protein